MIDRFDGHHSFLSNFHPVPVQLDGEVYPSVEHAYQAAKTHDPVWRERIKAAPRPGKAKRLGSKVPLRDDWHENKIGVMENLLRQKFAEPRLRTSLHATIGHDLVERNTWGDRFWGVVGDDGHNHLGRLLMMIRQDNADKKTAQSEDVQAFSKIYAAMGRRGGFMTESAQADREALAEAMLTVDANRDVTSRGNSHTDKTLSPDLRDKVLQSRTQEIEAFAKDRGLEPSLVFGIAEAALRTGRVPNLGMYGIGGDNSAVIAHFIAGNILNLAGMEAIHWDGTPVEETVQPKGKTALTKRPTEPLLQTAFGGAGHGGKKPPTNTTTAAPTPGGGKKPKKGEHSDIEKLRQMGLLPPHAAEEVTPAAPAIQEYSEPGGSRSGSKGTATGGVSHSAKPDQEGRPMTPGTLTNLQWKALKKAAKDIDLKDQPLNVINQIARELGFLGTESEQPSDNVLLNIEPGDFRNETWPKMSDDVKRLLGIESTTGLETMSVKEAAAKFIDQPAAIKTRVARPAQPQADAAEATDNALLNIEPGDPRSEVWPKMSDDLKKLLSIGESADVAGKKSYSDADSHFVLAQAYERALRDPKHKLDKRELETRVQQELDQASKAAQNGGSCGEECWAHRPSVKARQAQLEPSAPPPRRTCQHCGHEGRWHGRSCPECGPEEDAYDESRAMGASVAGASGGGVASAIIPDPRVKQPKPKRTQKEQTEDILDFLRHGPSGAAGSAPLAESSMTANMGQIMAMPSGFMNRPTTVMSHDVSDSAPVTYKQRQVIGLTSQFAAEGEGDPLNEAIYYGVDKGKEQDEGAVREAHARARSSAAYHARMHNKPATIYAHNDKPGFMVRISGKSGEAGPSKAAKAYAPPEEAGWFSYMTIMPDGRETITAKSAHDVDPRDPKAVQKTRQRTSVLPPALGKTATAGTTKVQAKQEPGVAKQSAHGAFRDVFNKGQRAGFKPTVHGKEAKASIDKDETDDSETLSKKSSYSVFRDVFNKGLRALRGEDEDEASIYLRALNEMAFKPKLPAGYEGPPPSAPKFPVPPPPPPPGTAPEDMPEPLDPREVARVAKHVAKKIVDPLTTRYVNDRSSDHAIGSPGHEAISAMAKQNLARAKAGIAHILADQPPEHHNELVDLHKWLQNPGFANDWDGSQAAAHWKEMQDYLYTRMQSLEVPDVYQDRVLDYLGAPPRAITPKTGPGTPMGTAASDVPTIISKPGDPRSKSQFRQMRGQ